MKMLSFLAISLFLISGTSPTPPKFIVSHKIASVTVYLSNAQITRKAQVNIPKGKSELVFNGISSRILEQGMKVHASDNVKIYAVSIDKEANSYEENEEWLAIEDQLEKLELEKSQIATEQISLKKEMAFLESNIKIGDNSTATFTQLDARATYLGKKIKTLLVKLLAQKQKSDNIDLQKSKLFDLQNEIEDKLEKTNTTIRVTVISDNATSCDIDLKYLVSNAIWKPVYSIKAYHQNPTINIEYQAQIYNDTGNDWENKPITLAIIDSSTDVSLPKMRPWVLDGDYDSNDIYSGEGKLSTSKGNYNQKNNKEELKYDIIQIDNLSTRFQLAQLHTIPADATPHLVDVTNYTKKVAYYTLSIPKVKNGAFLIAKIPNWENMGLLDGTMNLYYNDTFQGISQLDTRQVSDTLDISLGKDDAFSVTKRKLSSKSSKKLIGFNITEKLSYEIIIKNKRNQPAEIEIRDQLPVATDKNVIVKVLQISNAQLEPLSGQLTWQVALKPHESKKILLTFSVKYPKSQRGILRHDRKNIRSPKFF